MTLVFMRRLDAKIDGLDHKMDDLQGRVSELAHLFVSQRRDISVGEDMAFRQQQELDRLRGDVERIKIRLNLTD